MLLDQFSCTPGGGTDFWNRVVITGSGSSGPALIVASDSLERPIGSVTRTLTSTASLTSVRRISARYFTGLPAASRQAARANGRWRQGQLRQRPFEGEQRMLLPAAHRCGGRGSRPCGRRGVSSEPAPRWSSSAARRPGAVPGHSIVIAERCGGRGRRYHHPGRGASRRARAEDSAQQIVLRPGGGAIPDALPRPCRRVGAAGRW